jgi:hypothetical protein
VMVVTKTRRVFLFLYLHDFPRRCGVDLRLQTPSMNRPAVVNDHP